MKLHEVYESTNNLYLVYEFIDAQNLKLFKK